MNFKQRYVWAAAKFAFGIILIVILIWSCNIQSVLYELHSLNFLCLVPIAIIYAITLLFLSLRWQYLLRAMGYIIPVPIAFQAFSAGILLSDISPGRIGEISRPYYIREIVPAGPGLASYLLDRYVDFIGKVILCGLAVFFLASLFSPEMMIVFFLVATLPVFLISLFWMKSEPGLEYLSRTKLVRIHTLGSEIQSGIKRLSNPRIVIVISILLSLFASLLQGLRLVLLAWVLGYSLPLLDITILQSLVSSLALIPITISGLGLVEGGLTAVFSSYGVPAAAGVSIAILDRVITVGIHITSGIGYVLRK